MLKALIGALFPEGQRKLMVVLIALAVGAGIDQFGGGLDETMLTAILGLVAIFTGGNVLTHLSSVLAPLKGTKIGQIIEDTMPGNQNLGKDVVAEDVGEVPMSHQQAYVMRQMADQIQALATNLTDVQNKLQVQAQNTASIVGVINAMRGAGQQAPQRPAGSNPPPQERL
jgi:hypothetical protein